MPVPLTYVDLREFQNLVVNDDWSSALQAAVDSGKKVLIPEGEYRIDNVVNLLDGTNIEGSDRFKSVLKSKQLSFGSQKVFHATNRTNLRLSNLIFDGNADSINISAGTMPNANTTILYLDGCNNIAIENIEIKNFASHWDTSVPKNQRTWSTFFIINCANVSLDNVMQHHCRVEGVQLLNCINSKVNSFFSKDNEGIWTPLHIRSLDLAENSKNNQLLNSTIDGSSGSLMNISGENLKLDNLELLNAGNGFIDIGIEGLDLNEVSKNIIITNITCRDVKLNNTDTQGEGILFEGDGLVVSNMVAENIEIGLIVNKSSNVSINNMVVKNLVNKRINGGLQTNGICILETNSVAISGLIIDNVPNYGVAIHKSKNVRVVNTSFRSCGTNPISLIESNHVDIINSYFDNSQVVNYSRFFITDQYSTNTNCNEIKVVNCFFSGTSNDYGISLNNTTNTYLLNNSGQASIYTINNTNKAVLSSGINSLNYRTPLIWGSYAIWIDSSGILRVKNGNPTNDTDGTIVGN